MLKKICTYPVIIGCFVIAAVLGYHGFKANAEVSRLADHGKETVASIEGVEWTQKRGMDYNFKFTVSFTTADGKKVRDSIDVNSDIGKEARDDDAFINVGVIYLPEDPTVVRVIGHDSYVGLKFSVSATLVLIGLVLLGLRVKLKD